MNRLILKHAPATLDKNVKTGDHQHFELAFEPATIEEIRKALNLEKDAAIPDGYIAGWASTDDLDLYRHRVMPGAFSQSIAIRGLKGPRAIKLLLDHSWDKPSGAITKLEYRSRNSSQSLWIEAQLNLAIGYVRDRYEALKMIGGMNFSVGFMLQDYSFKEDDNDNEYLQIDRGDLFEVSIVAFPGNEDAQMTLVKDGEGVPGTLAEFERALIARGLAKSRNEAKTITTLVKSCQQLFVKAKDEPAPAPVASLNVTTLNEMTDLVSKMKRLLAPAAS